MPITILNKQLNNLVLRGEMLQVVNLFFADTVSTKDHTGINLNSKSDHLKKMDFFTQDIVHVNAITLHNVAINGNISFNEFTFDLEMKFGNKVYWHEIIKRVWRSWEEFRTVRRSFL